MHLHTTGSPNSTPSLIFRAVLNVISSNDLLNFCIHYNYSSYSVIRTEHVPQIQCPHKYDEAKKVVLRFISMILKTLYSCLLFLQLASSLHFFLVLVGHFIYSLQVLTFSIYIRTYANSSGLNPELSKTAFVFT